jgi:hypothetical protein
VASSNSDAFIMQLDSTGNGVATVFGGAKYDEVKRMVPRHLAAAFSLSVPPSRRIFPPPTHSRVRYAEPATSSWGR